MKKDFLIYVETLDEKEINRLEELAYMSKAEEERKKKQKQDKRKNRKTKKARRKKEKGNSYRLLLGGVLVIAALIVCSMLWMNGEICSLENSVWIVSSEQIEILEKRTESTLLTTGLAIIALAISVWAGLNIIQVLEKGKLDTLSKEVELYRQERSELNRGNFLSNLLRLEDTLNKYLYKRFSQIEDVDDDSAALYFEFSKIEQKFQNVFLQQSMIKRNLSLEYYKDAIVETEKLMAEVVAGGYKDTDVFIEYLKVRLAEFNFYLGYNVNEDDSIGCFYEVIRYFNEVYTTLSAPEDIMEKRYYLDGDKTLTLYIFNTIGEANSKILQASLKSNRSKEVVDDVIKNIEKYYGYVIELIENRGVDTKEGFEVYYRNYGCALERINKYRCNGRDNFENAEAFNKIKELYQKAIDDIVYGNMKRLREQIFYTYVSLYYKYIKSNDIMDSLSGNLSKLNLIQTNIEEFEKYTKEVDFYVDLAMNLAPLKLFYWKVKAFVERDYIVWAIVKTDMKNAKNHYRQFMVWWERIKQTEIRNGKGELDKPDEMFKGLTCAAQKFNEFFAGEDKK